MADTQYVKVQFPEHANELTIGQYQKYVTIEEGESNFKTLKAAEIFLGLPIREALKMQTTDFYAMTNELFEMLAQDHKLQPIVKYRGKDYGFIPNLEELTFGEYIDLDSYLTDVQNMHKALGVLYRPVTDRVGDKYDIEEYEPNEGYKDFPLGAGLGATLFFLDFKKGVIERYPELFAEEPEGHTDLSLQANFSRKWGWYGSIDHLAGGDINKYEAVTNQAFQRVFLKMIFDKEKNEVERMLLKKKG